MCLGAFVQLATFPHNVNPEPLATLAFPKTESIHPRYSSRAVSAPRCPQGPCRTRLPGSVVPSVCRRRAPRIRPRRRVLRRRVPAVRRGGGARRAGVPSRAVRRVWQGECPGRKSAHCFEARGVRCGLSAPLRLACIHAFVVMPLDAALRCGWLPLPPICCISSHLSTCCPVHRGSGGALRIRVPPSAQEPHGFRDCCRMRRGRRARSRNRR
jgi:hypothetical protein